MQLPPDYRASSRPMDDKDLEELNKLAEMPMAKFGNAGASDSWDDPVAASAGSKEFSSSSSSQTTPPLMPSFNFKEPPPIVVPENLERTRLLQLIEQSKLSGDKEMADARRAQAEKDKMAAILDGVNLFSSGFASQNAGATINVDDKFNKRLVAEGAAGVEGAKASRESKLKDLMGNYDRLREDMTDKRNAAADQRQLTNDKYDRIYKQEQLKISAANAAASREAASEARAANLQLRKEALDIKKGNEKEKDDTLQIPGYDRVSGRITPEEAKKTREAIASVGSLKDLLAQYKTALGNEGTFELFGEGSERLKKLTKGIQREMGRANEFGVIQAGELPMLEQMSTYDPESLRALFTTNNTAAAGIDQIVDNLDYKMANKVKSIGYAPKAEVFDESTDPRVKMFMSKNPQVKSVEEATKILKDNGKL